jgi:hypothetical protein
VTPGGQHELDRKSAAGAQGAVPATEAEQTTRARFAGGTIPSVAPEAAHGTRRTASEQAHDDGLDAHSASVTMQIAADIVDKRRRDLIEQAPLGARVALELLYAATVGRNKTAGDATPAQRREWLQAAVQGLTPARILVLGNDAEWVRLRIDAPVETLVHDIDLEGARQRVDQAHLVAGRDEVVEVPESGVTEATAPQHAEALLASIESLDGALATLKEHVLLIDDDELERELEAMAKGKGRWRLRDASIIGVQSTLMALKGALSLPDAWDQAKQADGAFGKVGSYAELVQAGIETVGGIATFAAAMSSCVAKLGGRPELAARLLGMAGGASLKLGSVLAIVEGVRGFCTLLDSDSTRDERLEAVVDLGVASLTVLGASTAGLAVGAGYQLWKANMALHAQASSALAQAGLQPRWVAIAERGVGIRHQADHLIKAGLLLEHETDPAERALLAQVVKEAVHSLNSSVDSFLNDCIRGREVSRHEPGENPHLRAAFASVVGLRGEVNGADAALHKASLVLGKINEVLDDKENFVRLSMGLDRAEPPASKE